MKIKRVLAALLLLALVGAVSWGLQRQRPPEVDGRLAIAASFYPLYDFAREVGGDKVNVKNMTPAGVEPHDYEPSPQALVAAQKSALFIYNGGTLEPWVDKFLPDYHAVQVRAADGINLLPRNMSEPGHAVQDPHFWLDPVLAQQVVRDIRDGLIKARPRDKDYFTQRAASFQAKLAQLDQDFQTGLAQCRTRTIVTSHAAFGYLAKRYNIEVLAIAGLSPEAEPSAAKLAELSQLIKARDLKYVFFESLASPKLAQTLAQETGTQTLVFDPIEGITDDQAQSGQSYLSLQRQNLSALRTALACR